MIKLGLVGWPVGHSLSPLIHNAALKAVNLDGDYGLFPVAPGSPDELLALINLIRVGELTGLNITIPYKQVVFDLVDVVTPTAAMIGAVNTLFQQNGSLVGENTDASGFLTDLYQQDGMKARGSRNVLVLGAGGSARAVVSALVKESDHLLIAARNHEQAALLANYFQRIGMNKVFSLGLDEESIRPWLKNVDLVVNTTPLGMFPKVEQSPWPESLPFPEEAFIYDLIYNPLKTRLVAEAQAQGLSAANGLGMLVEQAAIAFELWTKRPAYRDVMYSAVRYFPG